MSSAPRGHSRYLPILAYAALIVVTIQPEIATAQFTKATSAVESFKAWLWIIMPVLGLVAGGFVGLLYAFDVIRKETAYQWAIGIIFAGAIASGIVKLVF